jgi:hypothetical protein
MGVTLCSGELLVVVVVVGVVIVIVVVVITSGSPIWGEVLMGGYLPHIINCYFVDLHRIEHTGILADARLAKSRDEFELSFARLKRSTRGQL